MAFTGLCCVQLSSSIWRTYNDYISHCMREKSHEQESPEESVYDQNADLEEVFVSTFLVDADKSFLADLLQQSFKIRHSRHHRAKGEFGVDGD